MEAQQFQSEINVNCMQTIKFWYIQYQVLTCTLLIDTFEEDSWVWPQRPGGGGGCLKQMENLFGANWSTASKMLNIKVNRVGLDIISHLHQPIQSSFQVGNWRSSIFSVKIFEISRNYQSLEKRLEIWEGDCFSFLWMIYWVFKRINFSFYIFCTYPVFPRCLYLNLSDDIFVFVRSV